MSAKNKLQRFAENETFPNVIQPDFNEVFRKDYRLKQKWATEFWKNSNPLVLELGCGKGEYTVSLAERFPSKNYLGIDIKGARFWRGAKSALEKGLANVAFLRTRIEFIDSFFGNNEVDEIWITFPDPQLRERRAKKRLTSPRFLNMYIQMLKPNAVVNLKTDSKELFDYTKSLLEYNNQKILVATDDLYNSPYCDEILSIKTHYESFYLTQGKPITYIQFRLHGTIKDLPEEQE
ncbi:MAG: tRNA (guanosine(46)-N7)-methyltransferase TrmB [Bacteroidales bacterium]|nr:tRNA (guanosine(46)-N7)-methyltransferase TrmB [Bacteroidales bacterium]